MDAKHAEEVALLIPTTTPHPPPPPRCPHKKKRCCLIALLVVAGIAWAILKHICPHFRNGHHGSHHIWVTNGTLAEPPKEVHLHFDNVVDGDSVSIWFHKYEREGRNPHDGNPGDDKDGESKNLPMHPHANPSHHHNHHHHHHHNHKGDDKNEEEHEMTRDGDDDGERKKWFTRCAPDSVSDGVAVFGSSCLDIASAYEALEPGHTLTFALIATGKKADDHEDDGDKDDELDGLDEVELLHHGRRYYTLSKIRLHKHREAEKVVV
ncbi:hypothetical protein HDU98_001310 [Podochytrium sp. JEL0797]|nr:hypothetical protein HDU98_001310 [Podochytrium sp. JEL0797]